MDHVSVEGAFSIANITNTGTDACGVSYPPYHQIIALVGLQGCGKPQDHHGSPLLA